MRVHIGEVGEDPKDMLFAFFVDSLPTSRVATHVSDAPSRAQGLRRVSIR